MTDSISPAAACTVLDTERDACILVDVRSAAEFNSLHATPAIHIPLEQLTTPEASSRLSNKKIFCICQSGARGKQAVATLLRHGLTDVVNVEGGTAAWHKANLPVIKGASSISLERQVRIAAGALVFLGCLAGLGISPYFFGVPLFVGAGLVFSGVTDTCGMALILGRCPWNSK